MSTTGWNVFSGTDRACMVALRGHRAVCPITRGQKSQLFETGPPLQVIYLRRTQLFPCGQDGFLAGPTAQSALCTLLCSRMPSFYPNGFTLWVSAPKRHVALDKSAGYMNQTKTKSGQTTILLECQITLVYNYIGSSACHVSFFYY